MAVRHIFQVHFTLCLLNKRTEDGRLCSIQDLKETDDTFIRLKEEKLS